MSAIAMERGVFIETPKYNPKKLEQSPRQKGTPAFDLLVELRRIQGLKEKNLDLDTKKQRFEYNAKTYINEALHVSLGTIPEYKIETEPDGNVTLRASGYEEPAREIFNPHSTISIYPWPEYRQKGYNYVRAQIEYDTFCSLEKMLKGAKEGDTILWISPPPYEIVCSNLSDKEKADLLEKEGYGAHTNTFLFTVEKGQLQGKLLQSFLRPEDQRKLLKDLMQEDLFDHNPNELELLGTVVKPPKNISPAELKEKMDIIYQSTLQSQKIKPILESEKKPWADEQVLNSIHEYMKPHLEYVFHLLSHATESEIKQNAHLRALIEGAFHDWEASILALKESRSVDLSLNDELFRKNSEEKEQYALSEMRKAREEHLKESMRSTHRENQIYTSYKEPDNYEDLLRFKYYRVSKPDDFKLRTGCGVGSSFGLDQSNDLFSGRSADFFTNTLSLTNTQSAFIPTNYWGAELMMRKNEHYDDYECPKCKCKIPGEKKGSDSSTWRKDCPNSKNPEVKCDYKFACA